MLLDGRGHRLEGFAGGKNLVAGEIHVERPPGNQGAADAEPVLRNFTNEDALVVDRNALDLRRGSLEEKVRRFEVHLALATSLEMRSPFT